MKTRLFGLLGWIVLILTLSSCGSVEKSAREKLEEGDFETSAQLFEKVLAKDPSNAEAIADLKRARQGVIGNNLIQVRNLRAGGNAQGALDRLLSVVNLEKQWSIAPVANAQFTQDEESTYALKYFFEHENRLVEEGKFLLADSDRIRYAPIFANPTDSDVLNRVREHIKRAGRSKCSTARSNLTEETPYTNAFMRDYCAYWGAPLKKLPASERARVQPLFSGLIYSGEIKDISPELLAVIKGRLNDSLASSAWFDPTAPAKLELGLNGEAKFTNVSNLVSLIHEYDKSEPYNDTEKVTKTRQVPYTTTKIVTDPVTHIATSVPSTELRDELYTETQPVVRYRKVHKQYPYTALRHNQTFVFNFVAKGGIHNQSLTLALSDHKENQSDEQHLNVSEVGLRPYDATLIDPAKWIESLSDRLKTDLSRKLSQIWIDQNCGSLAAKTSTEQDERILRCGRDPAGAKVALVSEWYRNRYGLDASTVLAMISSQPK